MSEQARVFTHPPEDGGKPRGLVVLLHGVGADGADLIGLAPHWAPLVPHAEFVSPDAFFAYDLAPFGRQWFSLIDRSPASMHAGAESCRPLLDSFLDTLLIERGLDDSQMVLVGFSQGTMMALHTGLHRAKPPAGIIGFSGALMATDEIPLRPRVKPPVLLIHGDGDDVVPVSSMLDAARRLQAAGVPVQAMRRPNIGHSIDETGLDVAGRFLMKALGSQV